jgi:hypothetical protein
LIRTFLVFRLIAPFALVLVGALLLPQPALATQVRELSLAEMARSAGPVFSGRVTAVQPDQVHGLPVTRVTFQVVDGLKGVTGGATTLTFLGGGNSGQFTRIVLGMPTFSVGEDWVMLVYPPSEIGLTAPVGLYQGAFRVNGNQGGGPLREEAGLTVVLPASRSTRANRTAGDVPDAAPTGSPQSWSSDLDTSLNKGINEDSLPPGATVSYGAFMERLRELTGTGPASHAVQPNAAGAGDPAADPESAAAAAARGTRRQP